MGISFDPHVTGDDRLDDRPPEGGDTIEKALLICTDQAMIRAFDALSKHADHEPGYLVRNWQNTGAVTLRKARAALDEALGFYAQAEAVAKANRKRWG